MVQAQSHSGVVMRAGVSAVVQKALSFFGHIAVPYSTHNQQAFIVGPGRRIDRLKERGDGVRKFGLVATAASWRAIDEPAFQRAVDAAKRHDPHTEPSEYTLRLYYDVMFYGLARHVPGDLIEVGVSFGKAPRAILEYYGGIGNKKFYLVDPWQMASKDGDRGHAYCHDSDEMLDRFGDLRDAVIPVVGFAPGVLSQAGDGALSFVHLNVSVPGADLASLEALYPRVSAGGVIVVDAFAWQGGVSDEAAYHAFAKARGEQFIWLPTGQGVMVKRGAYESVPGAKQ